MHLSPSPIPLLSLSLSLSVPHSSVDFVNNNNKNVSPHHISFNHYFHPYTSYTYMNKTHKRYSMLKLPYTPPPFLAFFNHSLFSHISSIPCPSRTSNSMTKKKGFKGKGRRGHTKAKETKTKLLWSLQLSTFAERGKGERKGKGGGGSTTTPHPYFCPHFAYNLPLLCLSLSVPFIMYATFFFQLSPFPRSPVCLLVCLPILPHSRFLKFTENKKITMAPSLQACHASKI